PHFVQLHAPHEPRALVVMEAVARILRSQGSLVRTSCEGRPESEWVAVLGVEVDAHGTPVAPAPLDVNVRPVPVSDPAELLPLGRDAALWALLHPAAHDRPRLTADHLVQRESNPLFRVRYAYARTRAVSRNAAALGFTPAPGDVPEDTAPLLTHLADHPRLLARAAAHRAPDLLARHLVAVADATLVLLPATLPLGDEKPSAAHRARLALAEAAGAVLAGGLSLLGIDAPEHL
ncbi:DALR anticodon-binding domain-containing protein, partial [Streptomyces sp. NRRL F-525]|uniref:DALR anticodon-binding domain-containing protein n=1 Tax=Streptomyces sp. NRRL F-525 TaxID=1463861 RepID=UPI000524660E